MILLPVAIGMVFGITACQQTGSSISETDKKIAGAAPLHPTTHRRDDKERVIKPNEADYVPEQLAQALLRDLPAWGKTGKELADSLYVCSALHASNLLGEKSACVDTYSGDADPSCLEQRGYGKKSVGQVLIADRIDLNEDGVADYILSDRYSCPALSANQARVQFVMLSQTGQGFRLSYADWASYGLDVVRDPTSSKPVLIERAGKAYGTFTTIMHLVDGKFMPRLCLVDDDHGLRKCDAK